MTHKASRHIFRLIFRDPPSFFLWEESPLHAYLSLLRHYKRPVSRPLSKDNRLPVMGSKIIFPHILIGKKMEMFISFSRLKNRFRKSLSGKKIQLPFCKGKETASFHQGMKYGEVNFFIREALIKSLSDFILVFLFNARNKSTRIASYLRRLIT